MVASRESPVEPDRAAFGRETCKSAAWHLPRREAPTGRGGESRDKLFVGFLLRTFSAQETQSIDEIQCPIAPQIQRISKSGH
jgi:hypothetical protein